MAQPTRVAAAAEIAPGTAKVVEVGDKTLAVFNCDGSFYATDNTCKHRGGPLGEGTLSGTAVTCPWHGWEFDVSSGACAMDPSKHLQTYPVAVEGGDLFVTL